MGWRNMKCQSLCQQLRTDTFFLLTLEPFECKTNWQLCDIITCMLVWSKNVRKRKGTFLSFCGEDRKGKQRWVIATYSVWRRGRHANEDITITPLKTPSVTGPSLFLLVTLMEGFADYEEPLWNAGCLSLISMLLRSSVNLTNSRLSLLFGQRGRDWCCCCCGFRLSAAVAGRSNTTCQRDVG